MGLSIRLSALAILAVAGLAPATALPPQRAPASASVPGGTRLWTASYRDRTQQNYGEAVVASPDGSTVYVAGTSDLAHFTTVAYNAATGAPRWVARFYGLGYSQAVSMAVSPDGSEVFVVGYTEPGGSALPNRFAVVAYNASTGAKLWASHPFSIGEATSAAVSPDGATVYVTGATDNVTGTAGYVRTFAYDAATGARRWLATYRGAPPSTEPQSVAVSPDGQEVFATSTVTGPSGAKVIVTLAYNAATGATLWTRRVSGSSSERSLAVSLDGSGRGRGRGAPGAGQATVFVTGGVPDAAGGSSFTTTAFRAATGTRLWQRFYQGPGGTSAANAVTVSPDGKDVFVTGLSDAGGSGDIVVDYTTVGYAAASGTQLWATSYQPPFTQSQNKDGGVAAGVSPDGGLVFVTGGAPKISANNLTFTTIAYHASTGTTAWLDSFGGVGDYGWANSLAVGPAGQVYVTGAIGAHDGCCNFGTVAYQP